MSKKINITLVVVAAITVLGGAVLAMKYLDYRLMIGFILIGIGTVIAAVALRQELIIMVDHETDEEIKKYVGGK